MNRPVGDRAEGGLEVEVRHVGGEALTVTLLVERGDQQQCLLCPHPPQEAVLDGVDGGLGVPCVVDGVVEMHGEEFERSLQKRDGPEVVEGRAFFRVFLQRVDPAALPACWHDPVFQREVDHAPDDLVEGGAAESDERVAEAGGACCGRERGLEQELSEAFFCDRPGEVGLIVRRLGGAELRGQPGGGRLLGGSCWVVGGSVPLCGTGEAAEVVHLDVFDLVRVSNPDGGAGGVVRVGAVGARGC